MRSEDRGGEEGKQSVRGAQCTDSAVIQQETLPYLFRLEAVTVAWRRNRTPQRAPAACLRRIQAGGGGTIRFLTLGETAWKGHDLLQHARAGVRSPVATSGS